MKRLLLLVMVLLLAVPTVEARKKKDKAGKMVGSVYQDKKYDFKLTVHENWKARIEKNKSNFRLILTQRKYGTPSDYADAPDYTKVPRVAVFVDTSSMGVFPFVDSLLSEGYKSEQKKTLLKEFEFLNEPEIIPKGRSRIEVGGESGLIWKGQSKYIKEVQTSAGAVGGKRVYGSYGGAILAAKNKKTNTIVLFHLMCEWEYFEPVLNEVKAIVTSLEWLPGEEES